MKPEDALAHARRVSDEHAAIGIPEGGLEVERSSQPSDDQLLQWAVIEPDLREVRSTRRGPVGRAVTAVKQGQLRLMGQYHAQVTSTQSRINVHLSLRSTLTRDEVRLLREEVTALRSRVDHLEQRLHGQARDDASAHEHPTEDPAPLEHLTQDAASHGRSPEDASDHRRPAEDAR